MIPFKVGLLRLVLFTAIWGIGLSSISLGVTTESVIFNTSLYSQKISVSANVYKPDKDIHKPLLIMIHGTTYGKWVWDVPGASLKAFFVKDRSYPMIALDLPGYGDSSHILGDALIPNNYALVICEILKRIDKEFNRSIILIGHSLGGLTGNLIAGTKGYLIDGLVTLGWVHNPTPFTEQNLLSYFMEDYITMPEDQRRKFMYYAPSADQSVISFDMAHAYPFPRGNMLALLKTDRLILENIRMPVFLSLGDKDWQLSNYSLNFEADLFFNATTVTTYLQPNAGHTSFLHKNAGLLLNRIDTWISQNFPN